MGKDEYVCSYYTFTLLKKGGIYKSKDWVPGRALCPELHIRLLLERRRKVCHKQSHNAGSGRKAHPLRGIRLTCVKAVLNSLPCVWVVQLRFFICVVDGWLAKYYKEFTTKSQKEPQAQVYKALKQEISLQHGSNWKQCNVTCFAKSGPKVRIAVSSWWGTVKAGTHIHNHPTKFAVHCISYLKVSRFRLSLSYELCSQRSSLVS